MCRLIWKWIYAKQIVPRNIRGHLGGFRGHTFKTIGKLSNWHQFWFTSADSSGNGLNTSRPSITQGALGGGGRGHTLKSLGKLSNGWTHWHQIWYTSADSSGNGHRLNTIRPSIPRGHGGGLGGHKFKTHGKLSNWGQLGFTSADSSGNGHRLKASRPSMPQGAWGGGVRGSKFKSMGKLSNGWTDWQQIWYPPADSSGNGHRLLNITRPSTRGGISRGFMGSQMQRPGKLSHGCTDLAPNLIHMCRLIWEWIYAKQIAPRDTRGRLGVLYVRHSTV